MGLWRGLWQGQPIQTQREIEQMGEDLAPGDRLGQAPNQTRTPAIQILSVGLPRTEALPVANGRHQTVRSGGDWGRNLFGIKNRKLKLADRDVSGETSAVDLGGAPGGASFEHHSKSENTKPTPRSSISSFGSWTVHSGAGPISPGLGDRIFRGAHTTTWLTALEFGFRNRRGRWAPQRDHRHRVLRSPGGFQPIINLWPIKRNIPPKTNAITAASTLPSSPFDEGHIDMAWVGGQILSDMRITSSKDPHVPSLTLSWRSLST
jgi:hypothetical protein